jgi:hypothetical protein
MPSGLFATVRRWAATAGLAIAVTAPSLTGPAMAAPFVPMAPVAAPASSEAGILDVRYRRYHRGFRNDRRYYGRRHRGRDFGGVALGLGIGVPLGAYLGARPAYGYYDPYYDRPYYRDRYVVRRVVPRAVHRGYGNSHVSWCYNRYRSYRAFDNTFQPYNGPRQQCYSPYS